MNILVVDDNKSITTVLKKYFLAKQHEITICNDAIQGLELILSELENIPGLTFESKLFTAPEGQAFSLAGDIQIQFPIILP